MKCVHCTMNDREARRKLCAACRKYKQRNGSLPAATLLLDRYERSVGIKLSEIQEVPYGSGLEQACHDMQMRDLGYGRKTYAA